LKKKKDYDSDEEDKEDKYFITTILKTIADEKYVKPKNLYFSEKQSIEKIDLPCLNQKLSKEKSNILK
jgi:hypothetical protein